ncbi:hypothetical protein SKAU_G00322740 [Synaphobranchus kaupii]|uniref:Uncharacterized protein n=1 Tax=Synaphobranchus kaupii TaxID=118154 RepID=A0A9Q1IJY2_SYNKA|nr:hypothetical protein SKAU_G00322740 [Synaphobranchus kaupii]
MSRVPLHIAKRATTTTNPCATLTASGMSRRRPTEGCGETVPRGRGSRASSADKDTARKALRVILDSEQPFRARSIRK